MPSAPADPSGAWPSRLQGAGRLGVASELSCDRRLAAARARAPSAGACATRRWATAPDVWRNRPVAQRTAKEAASLRAHPAEPRQPGTAPPAIPAALRPPHRTSHSATLLSVLPEMTMGPWLSIDVIMLACALWEGGPNRRLGLEGWLSMGVIVLACTLQVWRGCEQSQGGTPKWVASAERGARCGCGRRSGDAQAGEHAPRPAQQHNIGAHAASALTWCGRRAWAARQRRPLAWASEGPTAAWSHPCRLAGA